MHPNRVLLDRFSVGDLDAAEQARIATHLSACDRCRALVDSACAEQKAAQSRQSVERFMTQLRERRERAERTRWLRLGVMGSATTGLLAAAAWLILLRPPVDTTRWKGAGFAVQRLRHGEAQVLASSDRIRAGDSLRIVITQPKEQPVSAWMVDANGRVDALLPDGSVTLPAGQQALPGSLIVNSPCVDAWLVIASGDKAATLAATLRQSAARRVTMDEGWLPAGVMAQRLRCPCSLASSRCSRWLC